MFAHKAKLISFGINLLSWTIEDLFGEINSAFAENKDVYRILNLCKLPGKPRKIYEANFSPIFVSHLRYNTNLFANAVKPLPWKRDYIDYDFILDS